MTRDPTAPRYALAPCPFCGRGSLVVHRSDRLVHEVARAEDCPTFSRIRTVDELGEAFNFVRVAGYPRGRPKLFFYVESSGAA